MAERYKGWRITTTKFMWEPNDNRRFAYAIADPPKDVYDALYEAGTGCEIICQAVISPKELAEKRTRDEWCQIEQDHLRCAILSVKSEIDYYSTDGKPDIAKLAHPDEIKRREELQINLF